MLRGYELKVIVIRAGVVEGSKNFSKSYLHFPILNCLCLNQQLICQRGLSMINVGYDGKVPNALRRHLCTAGQRLASARSSSGAINGLHISDLGQASG